METGSLRVVYCVECTYTESRRKQKKKKPNKEKGRRKSREKQEKLCESLFHSNEVFGGGILCPLSSLFLFSGKHIIHHQSSSSSYLLLSPVVIPTLRTYIHTHQARAYSTYVEYLIFHSHSLRSSPRGSKLQDTIQYGKPRVPRVCILPGSHRRQTLSCVLAFSPVDSVTY